MGGPRKVVNVTVFWRVEPSASPDKSLVLVSPGVTSHFAPDNVNMASK